MPIIYKYIIKEISRHFSIILAVVVGIYLAVDFFEKIDDFIEAGLPFSTAAKFFIFKIPFILAQITPVGVLLSVLTTFALMSRHNEIIALKSGGISVYYLLKPVLAVGFAACFFLFFMAEAVVPITMDTANRIWFQDVRKESGLVSNKTNIWFKKDRSIIHIKHYDAAEKVFFHVTLNEFDDAFNLKRRIDATKGEFKKDKTWALHSMMKQEFDAAGKQKSTFYKKKTEDLGFMPEDIKRVAKKSEEMNFLALQKHIEKIESEGYEAIRYRVDLLAKFSFPFICLILAVAGAGIGLKKKVREALPLGVAYGIGTAFFYWVFYSFCLSLGYGRILPPWIAVSAANLVFLFFGFYMMIDAE
jgi:lipopolysaccharide export system permease protein